MLHAAKHGNEAHRHQLEAETVTAAVTIVRWFIDEQLRLLRNGRAERLVKRLERLRDVLQKCGAEGMSLRDVSKRHNFSHEEIAKLAAHFSDVLAIEQPERSGPGRKASPMVRLKRKS